MYLADTNIISELMRPVPHAGVVRWVEALDQTVGFAVSAVSVDEILFGLRKSLDRVRWSCSMGLPLAPRFSM